MYRQRSSHYSINHSLTPKMQLNTPLIEDYEIPPIRQKRPLSILKKIPNPHQTRSRKQRLLEQKNTDIQRQNRRLYEKLRKIKLKNTYQSQSTLDNPLDYPNPSLHAQSQDKQVSLPHVSTNYSTLNSTKSQLKGILNNTRTFVEKYFTELNNMRNTPCLKCQDLGTFYINKWKIKVLLLDGEAIVLKGRKGSRQLTKKYNYEKVKSKMTNGLETWVRYKFQFQE